MTLKRNNPVLSQYWLEQEELLDSRVGTTLTIEELVSFLPDHKDGRRPRGKTAVRRLRHRLQLISRGPNNALGRGSSFEVLPRISSERATDVFAFGSSDVEAHVERLRERDAKEARKRDRNSRARSRDSR